MDIKTINKKIQETLCRETIFKLKDSQLLSIYIKTNSVKTKATVLESLLVDRGIDRNLVDIIIKEYLPSLIPAGTKGIIRGIQFNYIVKRYIQALSLDPLLFHIEFEKIHDLYPTSEIPDWTVTCRSTNKVLIGMNSVDLWSGGAQTNRGYKYVIDYPNTDKLKLICVVCNEIVLKNTNTKNFILFQIGFEKERLCYLNGLKKLIENYFSINIY